MRGAGMIKRFLSLSFILTLVLTSCSTQIPTSPDISGDVGEAISSSTSIVPESPSPSMLEQDIPLPTMTEPSSSDNLENNNRLQVILGSYTDFTPYNDDGFCFYKSTDWNDIYYTDIYIYNDIAMGELHKFAGAFGYTIDLIDINMYKLKNASGDLLILTTNSDIAVFNENTVKLDNTTIYREPTLSANKGMLFIPLRNIAELMGLYTYQRYSTEHGIEYLWISECSVLDEKEFIPDDNFDLVDTVTEPGYTGGFFTYSDYNLKEEGSTFSGVCIGDSFDEVVSLLGSPQDHVFYELDINPDLEKCYISYTLFPEGINDYADYISFFFENNILQKVLLRDIESIVQS
jgi:hypothetical protein